MTLPATARRLKATAEEVLARRIVPLPGGTVPLHEADDVVLLCARQGDGVFHAETWSQQAAFAHELAARGRAFAVTDDPALVHGKSVAWALPPRFIAPRLWNYARQVQEFAAGLEAQGNRTFLSAAETAYWENKAHMHRRLDDVGAATPLTLVVDAKSRDGLSIGFEPVVVKQEHSAGSAGIRFFATAGEAERHVREYAFRPSEHLIVQHVVPGATRDLRLTMVADEPVASATYWRIKSAEAAASKEWRTTATTHGSTVLHEAPPAAAVELCARVLADLGVRTAGFDLMWEGDDVEGQPLVLELSPFYQPNPPQPAGDTRSYKEFKSRRYRADGYLRRQHLAYREVAAAILDKGLY